jgi:DNA primase
MSAAALLARLDGVRRTANGWTAKCPAHPDRTASLSIAEGDDGRALLHCFAGCPAADVVAAIGLSLADLFPERIRDTTPQGRAAAREAVRRTNWDAALGVLGREAKIISIAAHELCSGVALTAEDRDRLALATQRIDAAREVLA